MFRPQHLRIAGVPWLMVAITTVLLTAAIASRMWEGFDRRRDQGQNTRHLVDQIDALLSNLKDAETGQRGFLLTGRDPYLTPYREAQQNIPLILDALAAMERTRTADQVRRIEQLKPLVKAKLQELQQTIGLRQNGHAADALALVGTDQGQSLMDQIRMLTTQITASSDRSLADETAGARTKLHVLEFLQIGGSLILLFILLISTRTVQKATHFREEAIEHFRKNQETLKTFVRRVPAAAAMLDREMRYVQASDRFCSDFGLDPETLRGRLHYELFPYIPDRWKEVHRRCLNGETLCSDEDLHERADGSRGWESWEVRPWGDSGGLPEGILIFTEQVTLHKQAQAELQIQHDRLEKIVATSPGVIYVFRLNADGTIALPFCSPGMSKMLPELADVRHNGKPLIDMMHPEDVPGILDCLTEGALTLKPWQQTYRYVSASRGTIWVEGYSVPTHLPDGGVEWCGFITEITERKRLEESLLHSRSEYQTLVENSPDSIVRFGADLRYIFVNKRHLEMIGRRREDIVGKREDELIPPADQTGLRTNLLRRVIATGQPEMCELSYQATNGERMLESRAIPELGSDGSVQSVLVINQDITDRRRLNELALRSSEAKAQLLFENSSQGILTTDLEGRIVDANAMVSNLFGYSHAELIGAQVEVLLPESLRSCHVRHREKYLIQPRNRSMGLGLDLQARRKDGTEFPIEISLTHIGEDQGGLTLATVTDNTARKRGDREREGLIQQLGDALTEKTVLLKEVHHRVKNNMAVVASMLGMQADGLDDERSRVALGECQQRVLSMALVHEYLYGTERLDRVNFREYAQELTEELCRSYAVSDRVIVQVEAELIDLHVGTAIPCGLILTELLTNAFKYAFPHGGSGEIKVGLARLESGAISLSCRDNGIGLPETFDWENTNSLGMRIVRILSKQIDGELTLDGAAGGTSVEVKFPSGD